MYGSILIIVTFTPLLSSRKPILDDAIPFPIEERTPPVTKMYFFCFELFAMGFTLTSGDARIQGLHGYQRLSSRDLRLRFRLEFRSKALVVAQVTLRPPTNNAEDLQT